MMLQRRWLPSLTKRTELSIISLDDMPAACWKDLLLRNEYCDIQSVKLRDRRAQLLGRRAGI